MSLSRERRSGGAEERRKKNTIFLNPWSISIYRFFREKGIISDYPNLI
ncbi:MAG: hypothetical protein F6K41_29420 [Symploca sp. SIO3E6]|nr:hypothetical protein [Caldora sp. SIO3E6]